MSVMEGFQPRMRELADLIWNFRQQYHFGEKFHMGHKPVPDEAYDWCVETLTTLEKHCPDLIDYDSPRARAGAPYGAHTAEEWQDIMKRLALFITACRRAYYFEDKTIVSDGIYDGLERKLTRFESAFPHLVTYESPIGTVGH